MSRDRFDGEPAQSSVAFIRVKTQTALGKPQHGNTFFRDPSVDSAHADLVSGRKVAPREF